MKRGGALEPTLPQWGMRLFYPQGQLKLEIWSDGETVASTAYGVDNLPKSFWRGSTDLFLKALEAL